VTGLPTLADVRRAAERIGEHVHATPVMRSSTIDRLAGAELHFKCENLQKVGAFKARGATNAVLSLAAGAAQHGVATHSSGNHAAALARAAAIRGVAAHIVMPRTAPAVKRAAVEGYGASITSCEPTLAARELTLEAVVARTGATFVHPYNDPAIIAGQGTAALELLTEVPSLDTVVAPVGGGGLLGGTALTAAEVARGVRVFGAEPTGADDARQSLEQGRIVPSVAPRTIADGLLTSLGDLTFAIIRRAVTAILTVNDEATVRAMRLVFERMKLVIEPSAAVAVAVVLGHPEVFAGRRVGIILSGGNVDLDHLPW
jgi:threonine dehydratase